MNNIDTRKLSAHVKRLRPTTERPDYAIEVAINHLREAATCLRAAGAPKALHRVQLALTSARGALRNSVRHRAKPVYYECGICEHMHPWNWCGDCRDDANRFTAEELDETHGADGYILRDMSERVEADRGRTAP